MKLTPSERHDRIDAAAEVLADAGMPALAARLREAAQEIAAELAKTRIEVEQAWAACSENGKLADQLWAQIGAVQALHHSDEWVECVECSTHGVAGVPWPCPTIKALDGEATDA